MRRPGLAILALVAGLALAVGPAAPAFAHAALQSSVPASESVLDQPPTAITLTFDEPVTPEPGAIRLLDSTGADVTIGLAHSGDQPSVVTASVPGIPNGTYVVAWRVVSQDGHPANGAYTFQVGRGAAVDTRGLVASVLNAQNGDPTVNQLATLNRLLTYIGIALAIGGAVFITAIWPGSGASWPARRAIWFGWGLLLVATLATLLVSGPYLTGRSIRAAVDLDVMRTISDTRVFHMVAARLVLVLLALPLLLQLRRGLGRNAQLAGVLLGELLLGTVALAGHGGSGRIAALGVVLDAVHLGAMALWLGGLALLSVLLLEWRSGPPDVRAGVDHVGDVPIADADDTERVEPEPVVARSVAARSVGAAGATVDERAAAVDRFSSVAFACVLTLVATGVVQAWRILPGGFRDLTTTDYGRTLLIKLVFVVVLVMLGWWSRALVRRRRHGRSLWRSVSMELVVAVAVLTVTATLTGTSPVDASTAGRTVSASMVQGNLVADVSVTPARVGSNELHLILSPPGGSLQPVKSVVARMTLPARKDLGAIPITLTPAGPNHYIGSGLQIPYPGTWKLEVVPTTADDATVLLSTNLKIGR
jgi:copper transport protein